MKHINQVTESNTTTVSSFLGGRIKREVLRTYICKGCNKKVEVARTKADIGPYKDQWIEGETGCDCEFHAQIEYEQKAAKKERIQYIFRKNSLINPSLQSASFEIFKRDSPELEKAYQKSRSFVETFDLKTPRGLFFQGTFGTGKSHLSVSIAKALTEKGFSTIFISTPKLLTKIRTTYNKGSEYSEESIIRAIANADLVVFDDIGAEGDISGWGMQKLFEVIDARSGNHNIFTTNLSSAELEQTKDLQRIFSRMMMNTEPVIMNGTDFRKRQFLKGADA